MLCIQLKTNDAFFCLAAEEYLLKNFSEDIFMLWQSNDTVVVGKHQNALAEVNYPFVHRHNIRIARRISGGGTVFHDSGNVNFAIIKNIKSPAEISFSLFTQPVVKTLVKLGVDASLSGRSDLIVDGKKISGNAQHIFKNRVLHHGTLLFDSNLETLGDSLRIVPDKYFGKAVQSVRSMVANIQPLLGNNLNIAGFSDFLLNDRLKNNAGRIYELTAEDHQAIQKLVDEKFSQWEWNFGYSPRYRFENRFHSGGKVLEIALHVERGIIREAVLSGDYLSENRLFTLKKRIQGKKHSWDEIREALEKVIPGVTDDLAYAFF